MIRRYNYTDRQTLPRHQLVFNWIEKGNGILDFSTDLDLTMARPLDPEGKIYVEAYSGSVVARFDFGSVEFPEQPQNTELHMFPPGLRPLFRVLVVEALDESRIIARADQIVPLKPDEIEDGGRSILPVEVLDLGDRIWDLRIEGTAFFLQLNSRISEPQDITILAKGADFSSLVYPAIIRRILEHLKIGLLEGETDRSHDWIAFAERLSEREPPEGTEIEDEDFNSEFEDWIQDAVEGFCRIHKCVDSFVAHRKEMESINA